MRLLLLSNSANKGEDYLAFAKNEFVNFLGNNPLNILFIPFAAVTVGYDEIEAIFGDRIDSMGNYKTTSIHRFTDYNKAIEQAGAIVVGGGNTYMLLYLMQKFDLISKIRNKILSGTPYIGWSAGANLACPTIRTTNDMPIVWPQKLNALNLVPFQINPHYTDFLPENFAGESRDMRLREFAEVNPGINIVGLREGSLLRIEEGIITLKGPKKTRIYQSENDVIEAHEGDDIQFLLN